MTSLLDDNIEDNLSVDTNKNYLEELVGEGRKFKTPEDLARGKYEADMFIESLKREKAELTTDYRALREEMQSRARLEELLDQLKNPQDGEHTTNANQDNKQANTDPSQLESLFDKKIREYESSKKEEQNFNLVKSKLQERYGSDHGRYLKEQMENLGLTKEDIDQMARRHPQVLIKTLGLDATPQRQDFQTPPQTTQRFAPSGPQKRTQSYYQKMRKENPNLYHDPKTALQMHNDAIALGQEFFDA